MTVTEGVISGVRETFKKLSLKKTRPDLSLDYLVIMNIPAMAARRDAAYDRAVNLLGLDLFSLAKESRNELYKIVLQLLDIAIEMTEAVLCSSDNPGEMENDPNIHYLLLLNDTIRAASSLLNHEIILFKEKKDLGNFIGGEFSDQVKSTDLIFLDSETDILKCIKDLIKVAAPAIDRYRAKCVKKLYKDDVDRYNRSLKEFQGVYSGFGASLFSSTSTC